eukprot:g15949.t1
MDREVLVALYNSTDGLNWKHSAGWGTNADLSDWHGVEVNGENRVVGLRLYSNNLQGSIPPQLGNLGDLKILDLSDNKLSGPIPLELGDLRELEMLVLYDNLLTGPIPPEVGKLTAVQILTLPGNPLSAGSLHMLSMRLFLMVSTVMIYVVTVIATVGHGWFWPGQNCKGFEEDGVCCESECDLTVDYIQYTSGGETSTTGDGNPETVQIHYRCNDENCTDRDGDCCASDIIATGRLCSDVDGEPPCMMEPCCVTKILLTAELCSEPGEPTRDGPCIMGPHANTSDGREAV